MRSTQQNHKKTFEIQQHIGFFGIAGLLEVFTAYVRPASIRPAMRESIREAGLNLKSKDIWRKN